MKLDPASLFSGIPDSHRQALLQELNKIIKNFREARWEPAELDGGRLAEIIYSILAGHTQGKFNEKPQKPANMIDGCRALENVDKDKFCRSIRLQMPRALITLYDIRNQRGVGHVGGDVDSNKMDATIVVGLAKWLICEMIRIFHKISTEEAEAAIESLIEKESQHIWRVDGKARVLNPKMLKPDQTLLLLYTDSGPVSADTLFEWVEHSNKSVYKRDVLNSLHKKRLIEFNAKTGMVSISPSGIQHVENKLLQS